MTDAERRAQKIQQAARDAKKVVMTDQALRDKRLIAAYRTTAESLRTAINNAADLDGAISLHRMGMVLGEINTRISALTDFYSPELNTGLMAGAEVGAEGAAAGISLATAIAAPLSYQAVGQEAVEFVTSFIAEDGLQLSDRIWRLDRLTRQTIQDKVEAAVIQGTSARDAARQLLRGGTEVSAALKAKMGLNSALKIGSDVFALLTPGQIAGNPLYRARLLMQTEINRAFRAGYRLQAGKFGFTKGMKWHLSKSHPRPDICDKLASQDLHGLGPGVYPLEQYPHSPAHPGCLCFDTIEIDEEVLARAA